MIVWAQLEGQRFTNLGRKIQESMYRWMILNKSYLLRFIYILEHLNDNPKSTNNALVPAAVPGIFFYRKRNPSDVSRHFCRRNLCRRNLCTGSKRETDKGKLAGKQGKKEKESKREGVSRPNLFADPSIETDFIKRRI